MSYPYDDHIGLSSEIEWSPYHMEEPIPEGIIHRVHFATDTEYILDVP